MATVFTLLGEVTALVDGRPVDLGPARQRCVLAALAVDAGQVVPVDRVVQRVWGPAPPLRARATLHSYLSRLRPLVGPVGLLRRGGGYLLDVDRDAVDLHRFRDLCARARTAATDQAETLLTEALRLWRGEALAGLGGAWVLAERGRAAGERLTAECDLADARLRSGQGANLVAELAARAAEHPLDERVAAQYLLALCHAGRPGEALEHYRGLRARMVTEIGTDPGLPLRHLHQRIIEDDRTLTAPAQHGDVVPVPRQLPPAPPGFTGRAAELAALTAHLDGAAPGGTMVVSAVAGAGGIGKTWLALHWAHRHADRFPDGQLFVDLQGFSPTASPVDPTAAVRGFLDALGVDPRSVPPDPHAQAGLYRSLVADKRVLVVVDNARNAEQVVPLLPGSPTCTVLVTSRHRLTGLATGHGARPLRVDVLSDAEARHVLVDRLGAARVAAEPDAAGDLLACCHGFPLALAIVAGRACADPGSPLAALAAELHEACLDVLDHDNPAAGLRAVLSWSHQALTAEQARVFALLGRVAGPDIGLAAAAGLAGRSEAATRSVLRALEDMHLVQQRSPARWHLHDLIKLYAADQEMPGGELDRALARLVDHYLHTARAADRLLNPHRTPIPFGEPAPDSRPRHLPDTGAALDWFTAEHRTLLAVTRHASSARVWQLAWALDTFLYRQGHLHDAVLVWREGLAAADRHGDPAVRVLAHRLLGAAVTYAGLHDEAAAHLSEALALAEDLGDALAQAHTHRSLAQIAERLGHDRQALEHATSALDLYRSLGRPALEALALNAVGWYLARLGEYGRARAHCEAALDRAGREVDAAARDSLGYIAHQTGDHAAAVAHYERALALFREDGDAFSESHTLDRLGHPYRALGRPDEARRAWQRAVRLFEAQHRGEEARRVRLLIAGLDGA
ncbi:BTAD domain-containing putative transcriptional regulator [Actinosynnema sp. NPDC047251]|uniref:Transcriptional regulator, SARP family n=1 Tax=Saccharothrix espanaensis (strain ATCC 51144 / DSM 44229 / JCM 9112 / NBRC 15066 / NRRL 15764) TaxID=1179773 RepID=K0JTX1_SACES|nr:BTAD domain-containing putative transcriptional regulator [Saccharothrix espanaensis]CCH31245.1 Transcriptional regulator, SARP family [Saccharothrix espanaensis DSM 44229]